MDIIRNHLRLANTELALEVCETIKDFNQFDENGLSLLHYAAAKNNVEVLDFMIKNGGDINILDRKTERKMKRLNSEIHQVEMYNNQNYDTYNWSLLHWAVSGDHQETIEYLLRQDPILSRDNYGYKAFHVAFNLNTHIKYPRLFNKFTYEDLRLAAHLCYGDMTKIKFLLDRGLNVNEPFIFNNGRFLHDACLNHNVEHIKNLINRGADKTIKDKNGYDAVYWANKLGRSRRVLKALGEHVPWYLIW